MVDNSDVEEGDFVRCSVPANLPSAPSVPDTHLSKNAIALTPTLCKSWNIKTLDYFTIYYNNAEFPLEAFKNSLTSLRMDEIMANQHWNLVSSFKGDGNLFNSAY